MSLQHLLNSSTSIIRTSSQRTHTPKASTNQPQEHECCTDRSDTYPEDTVLVATHAVTLDTCTHVRAVGADCATVSMRGATLGSVAMNLWAAVRSSVNIRGGGTVWLVKGAAFWVVYRTTGSYRALYNCGFTGELIWISFPGDDHSDAGRGFSGFAW